MPPSSTIRGAALGHPQADASHRRPLRIALLSVRDPRDRRSWSGIHYQAAQALEKHCGEVIRIGPLRPFRRRLGRLMQRCVAAVSGRNYLYTHTLSFARTMARSAEEKLSRQTCDVIFAPAGSGLVAQMKTSIPIVYLSDSTTRLLFNYYDEYSKVLPSHARMAEDLEQLAISKASQSVFPSSWAAESAVRDYGADPAKVHVVPFGANIEHPPTREEAVRRSPDDICRLLFVGVEWDRKGGDIAVETLLALERMGARAELTIVGCVPAHEIHHASVNIVGFLNKNDPQDRLRLEKIYRHSDFFLLPTRAECYGIVFCEANAYGLPVLSTATGGIPEIVRNGVNGFLLPLEARGEAYAAHILSIFGNPAKYRKMRAASREQFETRLNWDAWGKRMNEILWSAVDSTQVDSTQIEPAPRSPHPEAELNSVKLGVDAKGQGR